MSVGRKEAAVCNKEYCRLPPKLLHNPPALCTELSRSQLEALPTYYPLEFSMLQLIGARDISVKKQNFLTAWHYEGKLKVFKQRSSKMIKFAF